MKAIGSYLQDNGPNGVSSPTLYYAVRYNCNHAHMSKKPLGWQILISAGKSSSIASEAKHGLMLIKN